MMRWNKNEVENVEKIHRERQINSYKCKCGHSVVIRPCMERNLCKWCGHYVYKDKTLQKIYDNQTQKKEDLLNFKKEINKRI